MRACGYAPRTVMLAVALVMAPALASAQPAAILSCKLTLDDGVRQTPPSTEIVRVSADEYVRFDDGAWGRNQCGAHGGGEAPDVNCRIREGRFEIDWVWRSNVGVLERHVLLDLNTGELTDRDHNGLEQKGVCRPTTDPATTPSKTSRP